MGCGGSKDAVAAAPAGEGEGEDNMEFGNPLQGGKGGSRKKVTWKPAQEQSEEDMRRSRLVLSTFDGLVFKLKQGKKEHEFVAAMSDIEVYVELKPHAVPDDAQKLLLDARNGLLRNARRGPFWKAKAAAGFYDVMNKMPVKMDLGNWIDGPANMGKAASAKGVAGKKGGSGRGGDDEEEPPDDYDGGDDDGGDEEGDEEAEPVDDEEEVMEEPKKKRK